ncbi:hypothetical protein [Streptomyces cinerochromogenes]|uniref:hypothetical protein n=1 Tax=Streptomyces cinerochromogenes TaxID=66422 RepID=UPI0033BE0202
MKITVSRGPGADLERRDTQEPGEVLVDPSRPYGQRCTVSPTDMPDLDAESGEQPRIPEVPAPKKKRRGRNSFFDDVGPAAGVIGGA